MSNIDDTTLFTILSLVIGFTYGVVAQRKQFCFSGGIKDIILFKHTRRTASLMVAISTAVLFTQLISHTYEIDLTQTRYYLNINYLFIIIGGLMFGYGMMISDGCSSRHLIKLAQKDKDSFFILLALGIFSYLTYYLMGLFNNAIYSSKIVELTTIHKVPEIPLYVVSIVLAYLLYRSLKKCMNFFQVIDGLAIGLLIAFVWFATSVISSELFVPIATQGLSFVYPLGKIVEYVKSGFNSVFLIFSVLVVIGVLVGAFVSSLFNEKYSKKYICDSSRQNPPSLLQKVIGGAFMGIGGVLALGCTVGQGLSGVSTLSSASFLAIGSIYLSAYLTAKHMHKNNALVACFVFDFETKKK